MGVKLIQDQTLTDIADAIRLKTDETNELTPVDMRNQILQTGFGCLDGAHWQEAQEVAEKIRHVQLGSEKVLVFGVVTDSHVNVGGQYEPLSKLSVRHGAFALETLAGLCGCDFLANLGDNCWGNNIESPEDMAASGCVHDCITAAFAGRKGFHLVGNHDQAMDPAKVYAFVGSNNTFDARGATLTRGYGYSDLTDKQVRVIVLNSSDYWNATGGYDLSYEQKDFLMRALDLSEKEDWEDWQILILSHFPLDYPNASSYNTREDVLHILEAYTAGDVAEIPVNGNYAVAEQETPTHYATYDAGFLRYDYHGKNVPRIIGNIHGHVHNISYGKMANDTVVRMATPNTCFYLEKLNDSDAYATDETYGKTVGTERDTAVTFYAVDLERGVIHSFVYGAGIDRVVAYGNNPTYSVTYQLSGCTCSATTKKTAANTPFWATFTPEAGARVTTIDVTMGGVDVTGDCCNGRSIHIFSVTGDLVITAVAQAPLWAEDVTDVAVAIRSLWHMGESPAVPELNAGNSYAAIGVTSANGFPYTDREGNTVYIMPVPENASQVLVVSSDGIQTAYRFWGLRDNHDGTLTEICDSEEFSEGVFDWEKGTITHILIAAYHTDGSGWDWGYDDTNIEVVFTNR